MWSVQAQRLMSREMDPQEQARARALLVDCASMSHVTAKLGPPDQTRDDPVFWERINEGTRSAAQARNAKAREYRAKFYYSKLFKTFDLVVAELIDGSIRLEYRPK